MQRHLRVLGARLHGRGRGRATLRAMAEYHEAFWVAIAGAAPVIGLAHGGSGITIALAAWETVQEYYWK